MSAIGRKQTFIIKKLFVEKHFEKIELVSSIPKVELVSSIRVCPKTIFHNLC
jgi:hypothetical protein